MKHCANHTRFLYKLSTIFFFPSVNRSQYCIKDREKYKSRVQKAECYYGECNANSVRTYQ